MQPDPEPGTGDQQRDPSVDGVQQDPLPEISSQDSQHRQREQLRQDPLPEKTQNLQPNLKQNLQLLQV